MLKLEVRDYLNKMVEPMVEDVYNAYIREYSDICVMMLEEQGLTDISNHDYNIKEYSAFIGFVVDCLYTFTDLQSIIPFVDDTVYDMVLDMLDFDDMEEWLNRIDEGQSL